MDILQMQLYTGRMNASRVLKPAGEAVGIQMPVENEDKKKEEDFSLELQRRTDEMQNRNLYRMQKAAQAYGFNMTA